MASLSSALNFLNNGTAPQNVNTSAESSQILPEWYTDYAQNMLQQASQYANQGAPIFPGQQVANLTPQQEQSYQTVGNLASTYGGTVPGAINTVNSANPYAGLNASSPYLNTASDSAANTVGQFMNPYTQSVVGDIATLGQQNLQDYLLPTLQSAFTSAGGGGHYGSGVDNPTTGGGTGSAGNSQEGTYEALLGKQVEQNISQQQDAALQSGYGQALNAAQQNQQINAGLANTAGQLGNLGASNQMTQGMYTGNLANTGVGVGNQIAGALNAAGSQQQQQGQANINAAMNNYYTQFQWPATALGTESSALSGVQIPTSTYNQSSAPLNSATYGASPLQQLGGLYSSGSLGSLANYIGSLFS